MSTLRVLENQTWISEMKLMIAIGLMLSFRTVSPADPIEAGFVLNGGSFNWFTHPGATTGTVAGGINDAGQIAGYYDNAYGFVKDGAMFNDFSYPGAPALIDASINNTAQVVGTYFKLEGLNPGGGFVGEHGFLKSGSVFQPFTYSLARGSADTRFTGINDGGQIVGYYEALNAPFFHSFLLNGSVISPIAYPGAALTIVTGINDSGDIVGWYENTLNENEHGFLKSGSTYTNVDCHGASNTSIHAISNTGTVAGACDGKLFTFDGSGMTFLKFPAYAFGADIRGINNRGDIVGSVFVNVPEPNIVLLTMSGIAGLGLVFARGRRCRADLSQQSHMKPLTQAKPWTPGV